MRKDEARRMEFAMLASFAVSLPLFGAIFLALGNVWMAVFFFLSAEIIALQVGYRLNEEFRRHGASTSWRRWARLLLHRDDRPPVADSDLDH